MLRSCVGKLDNAERNSVCEGESEVKAAFYVPLYTSIVYYNQKLLFVMCVIRECYYCIQKDFSVDGLVIVILKKYIFQFH